MAISREVKIGLLALVSGVLLYFGFNFLKGSDFLSSKVSYYAIYPNVAGLDISNPVTINGVQVGQVLSKQLLQNQANQVLLTLDVEKSIKLNDSTLALIGSTGLLSDKEIKLTIGKGTRELVKGDTLKAAIEANVADLVASQAKPLARDLDSALKNITILVKQFQQLTKPIKGTMENLEVTSNSLNSILAQNQRAIKGIADNLNTMSASLNDPKTGIKPMLTKFNAVGDSLSQMQLSQTVAKANQSIANINKLLGEINQGQGTLGKLAKNDSLYNNLNRFSSNLDSLMVDFRQSPKRYVHFSVFGKKDKGKKK